MEVTTKPDPVALMRHAAQDAKQFHATMAVLHKLSPKSLFDSTYDDLKEKGRLVVKSGIKQNATQDEKVTAIVTLCALAFMSRVTAYQNLLAAANQKTEDAES